MPYTITSFDGVDFTLYNGEIDLSPPSAPSARNADSGGGTYLWRLAIWWA